MAFKPIVVSFSKARAIEAALAEVNGSASRHSLTTYRQVSDLATSLLYEIDDLPLRLAARATLTHVPAGPSARAYRFAAVSTEVVLRVGSDGKTVKLVGIKRTDVYPRSPERNRLAITRAAKNHLLDVVEQKFGIVEEAAKRERADPDAEAAVLA